MNRGQLKSATADRYSKESFGSSIHEHQQQSFRPFPNAYLNDAVRVLRNSGAGPQLEEWRIEDGAAARGRKAYISMESALILMLMHVREGNGLRFSDMASTLANRLDQEQFAAIGIRHRIGGQQQWYDRLWRAVDRLIGYIDAFPGPRKRILKDGAYQRMLAARDEAECDKKEIRAELVANLLVQGSVDVAPREAVERWRGNIALDATFVALYGKEGNPSSFNKKADRRSINSDGGWYKRGGDHNGNISSRREKLFWGLEMESTTMTANAPGQEADFPLLTVAIGSHKPGQIKWAGKRMLDSILARQLPIGHVMCDRAYMPGAMPDELQGPFLDAGYTAVFDYGIDSFGKTAHHEHAIQVMGQWYVNLMPKTLVNAESLYAKATRIRPIKSVDKDGMRKADKTIAQEKAAARRNADARRVPAKQQLDERRQLREIYRLTRKGRPRPDGSQQYSYPDPTTYLSFDPITKKFPPPLTKRSVVIPRDAGLKWAQKYVHGSEKWKSYYSLRNTVEASYSHIKRSTDEALGDASKRPKRGNTFAVVAMALSVASANLRKTKDYIARLGSAVKITSKNRNSYTPFADGIDAAHDDVGPPRAD